MFDYLTKFKRLPQELQAIVSSPKALEAIKDLEEKYGVDLAAVVIKVMVKEISWPGVVNFLIAEHHLPPAQAEALRQEMAQRIFSEITRYLGIAGPERAGQAPKQPPPDSSVRRQVQSSQPQVLAKKLPAAIQASPPAAEPAKGPLAVDGLAADIMPQAVKLLGIEPQASEQGKLKNILVTFIKGIRDFISAREALMRERENGGLGLSKEQAEAALNLVQKNKRAAGGKAAAPKAARPAWEKLRDVEYDFSALAKAKPSAAGSAETSSQDAVLPSPAAFAESKREIAAPKAAAAVKIIPAVFPQAMAITEPELAQASAEVEPKIKPVAPAQKESVRMRRPADKVEQDRRRLDDIIRPRGRLQGPIEELANLDLVNFRRLGGSPEVMAGKIQNKIKLLEQESFTKRQQGINAWRHSPLYQLYIGVGHKALTNSRSIADALQENSASADALTSEEFEAILELNRQLRV